MYRKNNAGAVASNAGDDFHLIWACKKLLEILVPNSKLTAISVEGPTWEDSTYIEDEQKLYSIDLAEYYGGNSFEQAQRIVFSQLKYSAYQMDKSWTASNLCSGTNKGNSNSIIRRLADTYNGFCEKYDNVNSKLILKLVSNRSLHTDFSAHLDECTTILKEKKYRRTGDLIKKLTPECQEDINKIYKTSKLSSTDFINFLLILNFDDCGTKIRSIHRAEIIKQLGYWNTNDIRSRYNSLIMHLREMMLPEGTLGFPMDREYVLAALDTSINEVFPAPIKIQLALDTYIERDAKNEVAECIKKNQKKIICLQATAGAGKTTFVSHLHNVLPKDSISVLFDCYGGGSFLQPGERRHLTEVAIPQICNTLATECGTEWIFGRLSKEYEYWRMLNDRLVKAVSYVKRQNPSAVVVIIIDAADNSMVAANMFKEECFLQGLLNQTLPDDVWIIITTRIERRHFIPFGDEVEVLDLPPFELSESSQHVRSVFSDATDVQCEEFHLLTDRNPRLQAYMLSEASSIDGMLSQIKPKGKTMDSLFKEFIHATKKQYNCIVDIEILFSALINLPRPIPAEMLCELCSITFDTLMSMSVECRRGFYIADSFIFFKDEDFETYLRTCYENNENAIKLIADYMYKNRVINPYCARYLHIFMDKTDRFDCLVQIALNEKIDDIAIGIAETNQIMKQRIQYVLKRNEMYAPQNRLLACKLVYRLIDYNAKEDALKELLLRAPDEAVMYCDELSVYNIFYTDSNDFDSLGKAALVFSRLPIYKTISQQYIKSYMAAIRVYYNKNERDRGFHSRPETTNILNVAEAMLRLGELDKAVNLICGWNPRIAATKFVYELFKKLLKYNYSELFEALLLRKWSSPNKLAIVCAYVSLGKTPPKSYIDYLLKLFNRMKAIPESRFSRKQLLMFAEYILHIEDAKDVVSDLINKFYVEFQFSSVPSLYMEDEQEELSDALRYYALSHVCKGTSTNSADFWKAKANLEQSQSEDIKKSIIQIVDFLLPLYVFRLTCIQKKEDGSFLTVCNEILSKIDRSSWSFHSYDKHKLLEIGLLVFTESICLEQSLNPKEIKGLIDKTLNLGNTSPQFKLESLRKLICNERAFQAGLVVLEEINATYEKYPTSAKEMAEVYLSCAQMGQSIDNGLGAKYFAKAIECTKGLDYESYRKIYLYKTLADKIQKDDTSNPVLAYRIIRLSEDFCRKMGDTKNFPYRESLSAASLLSPISIWGALCRLDDRDNYDGFSLQDTIPIVLGALLETNQIPLENTIALIGLLLPDLSSQYNDLADVILKKISQVTPGQQKPMLEILIHDVLFNIPMDEKQYRSHCIVKYLDSNVYSPELNTDKIRAMDGFLKQLETQNRNYDYNRSDVYNGANIKQYKAESNIVTQQELEKRLIALNATDREGFVKEWLEGLSLDRYTEALTWMMELISKDYHRFGTTKILCIIADFVDSVRAWPQIDEWRNDIQRQKHCLQAFSREILQLYDGYESVFSTILRIFPTDASVQYEAFLEYVSDHIELYDEQLVKAICRMSIAISTEDAIELLKWTTEIEMGKIHPASGDNESYKPAIDENGNFSSSVACFIWRLLGHKDKGVRCKAAHVLLRSSLFGDVGAVEQISELYFQPMPQMYLDNNNYFFIESARLWYLATCLRIGKENAKLLTPLYSFFKSIACAEGVLHALHRRIARDICLQIAPYCEPHDIEKLFVCDQCISSESPMKKMSHYQRECKDSTRNWKFDFDTMDTLRYWYDDLAEMFACTEEEIATECDYFVAQFEITNQNVREWSKRYLAQNEYQKTYNDHGVIPTVETLEKYAEWHSMFYVADKYRQNREQIQDEDSSYEDWLNKYLPGKAGFWCFEFRNHTPLIPLLWDFTKTVEDAPERRYLIPRDLASMMIEHSLGVSLNMKYYAHFQKSNRYIRIESAFVEKEGIDKLVAEMKKPYTVLSHFYYEEDEYENEEQPELAIYPTCDVITTFPDYALDKKDLLLKDYLTSSNYLMGVSDELAKNLSVTLEEQILRSRIYNLDDLPVQVYHWSEPEDESGYEKHSTYGNMVIIKKECLLNILKKRNQAIIFEVSVSFEDDSYKFYGTPSKPAKEKKLFSLDIDNESNDVSLRQLSFRAEED
jgi:energy-coupling factor transporter ATP-binding protein EcfA2